MVPVLPAVREARPRGDGVHAEGHREIEQHDVALCDGRVVHAHRSPHRHTPGGPHPRLRVHDRHLDVVAPAEEVGDGVELAGQRIPLRMRGVSTVERASEVTGPKGLELVAELVGTCTGLDDGERATGVPDDIGVGCEVHIGVHRAGPRLLSERARHLGRAHPAVAIPLRPPVAQPDPVHHAVAREPMIGGGLGHGHRVGPVAQVAPVQDLGQLAPDGQLGHRQLLVHGSKVALQVRIDGRAHDYLLRRVQTYVPGTLRTMPSTGV